MNDEYDEASVKLVPKIINEIEPILGRKLTVLEHARLHGSIFVTITPALRTAASEAEAKAWEEAAKIALEIADGMDVAERCLIIAAALRAAPKEAP